VEEPIPPSSSSVELIVHNNSDSFVLLTEAKLIER
jgi:hypothetical protein